MRESLIQTLPTVQGAWMIQLATFPKTKLAVIVNLRYVAFSSSGFDQISLYYFLSPIPQNLKFLFNNQSEKKAGERK